MIEVFKALVVIVLLCDLLAGSLIGWNLKAISSDRMGRLGALGFAGLLLGNGYLLLYLLPRGPG